MQAQEGKPSSVVPNVVFPFQAGDLIVHATHGVSRYMGTRELQADDGSTGRYFQLEYAEGDRIFVPVEHLARLSKHLGQDVALARLSANSQPRSPYTRSQKLATSQP